MIRTAPDTVLQVTLSSFLRKTAARRTTKKGVTEDKGETTTTVPISRAKKTDN